MAVGGTESAQSDNPVCGLEAWGEGINIDTGRLERHQHGGPGMACQLPLGHESPHWMEKKETGEIWEWPYKPEDITRAQQIFRDRRKRG